MKSAALVIAIVKNPGCFKNQSLGNIKYTSSKNAWMTSYIFKEELISWDTSLIKSGRKILLLLDNCSPHLIDANILSNIKLIFLPPNSKRRLQPLDNGIIKNFKIYYGKILVTNLLAALEYNVKHKISIWMP